MPVTGKTVIDLMRHGEPVGGRAYRGNGVDDPLSEKGWQQMWSAVAGNVPWDHVISSPMARCREFAVTFSGKHSMPVSIENDLREIGFGSWEGKTPDEIIASNRLEYENFYRDPVNRRPAGAEDLYRFRERVMTVLESVLMQFPGKHVLLVAHAGVIRALLTTLLKSPAESMYSIRSGYAGITRIEHVDDYYHIAFHNMPSLPD